MKKILIILLFTGSFGFVSNAQTDITVNPIGLLFSNFNAGVDFGLSNDFSIEPRIGLAFGNNTVGGTEFSSFGFTIGAIGKYYFTPKNGCDKWHIGPYLNFSNANLTADGENDISRTVFGIGLYSGYKVVSSRNIVFDFGLGLGRNFVNEFDDGSGNELDLSEIPLLNISVIGKIAVGYRFGGGER